VRGLLFLELTYFFGSMLFYQAVAEDYNEPEEDGKKQSRLSFSTTDLATLIFLVDVSVQYTFLLLFKANFD
jgi:hypothetical protein